MDLADDIAYSVHDVEDAVVGGRLDLAVLSVPDERARVVEAVQTWYGDAVDEAGLRAAMDRLVHARLWAPVSTARAALWRCSRTRRAS